jgi:hypothetical protein
LRLWKGRCFHCSFVLTLEGPCHMFMGLASYFAATLQAWKHRTFNIVTSLITSCEPWLSWLERCFTQGFAATLEGSFFQCGLWTKTCTLLHDSGLNPGRFTATVEELYSRLVNQEFHAASRKDSCFTAIWKNSTHGRWLVNQDLHAASLRLWKDRYSTHCLWTKTCTLLHCDSGLNPGRIVALLRLWKDRGKDSIDSRLVNQDLYAASLRLWMVSTHVWTPTLARKMLHWMKSDLARTMKKLVNLSSNLSLRLLWDVLWLSSRLSRMALPSEEHVINTESVAPAKAQRPETWIGEDCILKSFDDCLIVLGGSH